EPLFTGSLPLLVCGVAFVVALLLSSVTVLSGAESAGTSDPVTVRLSMMDGSASTDRRLGLGTAKAPARFTWLRTTPFGQPYRLAVDGYVEQIVTVYPIIGLNVIVDRDLRRSPSVLFRPSIRGVQTLNSEGKLLIS